MFPLELKFLYYRFYSSKLKREESLFINGAVSSQFLIFISEFNRVVRALGLDVFNSKIYTPSVRDATDVSIDYLRSSLFLKISQAVLNTLKDITL